MVFILNVRNGKHYETYPSEYNGEIKLLSKPGFEADFAVFKILDAVYNYGGYRVKMKPELTHSADIVFNYRISSPLYNKKIYITEFERDNTPERTPFEDHNKVTVYDINIGNVYKTQTFMGVKTYQVKRFTDSIRQAWGTKEDHNLLIAKYDAKRAKLIKVADDIHQRAFGE